ncbi:molybdopterin-dependent oxidoreductase [Acinetobacter sp. XS-4]|uniref:molybdopterin-containing oxidoreductase family protein n=1 Tax=Acinetobacter sp. XS-4 TaxID=2923375 RepID=UPI00208E1AB3|nr:molybdopterin-dependent oxidoreductase [Acinetobacter sp. XS-4]USP42132.1 molybdopterin-dependent oxidoreductase [Acinetobacter sp. XS-4]
MASSDKVQDGAALTAENATELSSICVLCSHNCGVKLDVKDNTIVKVKADKTNPTTKGYICNKAFAIPNSVHHKQRVHHPLKKMSDGTFSEITWDQAIHEIAEKLKFIQKNYAPRAIGIAGVGGQGNHSNVFGALPLLYSIGSGSFFNALGQEKIQHPLVDERLFKGGHDHYLAGDEHNAAFVLYIGTNPLISNRGINATETIREIVKDPNRKIAVIDPRVSETARRADFHLCIKPAQDVYLLLALNSIIVRENLYDQEYIKKRVKGFEQVAEMLKTVDLNDMAKRTELTLEEIQTVAREFARASSSAICYDLGVDHGVNTTLISYLIRTLSLITGNLGEKGGNIFVQQFGPKFPILPRLQEPLESNIKASALIAPMMQFSPNLIPEEILSSHPHRIRALIVDGANPLVSYVDSKKFREAFEQLDLLVVIEPNMTETAQVADYVLPTPAGYEKWEIAVFPKDVIYAQVRPPVISGPSDALPEIEIYYRLAKAMGIIKASSKWQKKLAKKIQNPLYTPIFLTSLGASAFKGKLNTKEIMAIIGRIFFILYETLGPQLKNPLMAYIWLLSVGYALTRKKQINLQFPELKSVKNPFVVAQRIFELINDHPEGVILGLLDEQNNFNDFCHFKDKKARLFQDDFIADLKELMLKQEEISDYPFILDGGMRTGWTANTIVRDPSWRKGREIPYAMLVNPSDAESLNIKSGDLVNLQTKRGEVIVPVSVDGSTRKGHLHLPNLFNLKYPDPETGELVNTGVSINELSDVNDRDKYTGIPNLKYIRCKINQLSS